MICPLISRPDKGGTGWRWCRKEDCAWWLKDKDKCSIRVVAEAIDNIDEQGMDIFKKE